MNFRYHFLPIVFLFSISACSSSPQSLAENHLDLIKLGSAAKANQQYCTPSETLRLYSIKSFKIISSQQKSYDNLPYTEVIADIDTDQYRFKNVDNNGIISPQKEVLHRVTFEIWKSDDIYQAEVKSQAKINDISKSLSNFTGDQAKISSVPDRGKVNKESQCVFMPFEQFENDK